MQKRVAGDGLSNAGDSVRVLIRPDEEQQEQRAASLETSRPASTSSIAEGLDDEQVFAELLEVGCSDHVRA